MDISRVNCSSTIGSTSLAMWQCKCYFIPPPFSTSYSLFLQLPCPPIVNWWMVNGWEQDRSQVANIYLLLGNLVVIKFEHALHTNTNYAGRYISPSWAHTHKHTLTNVVNIVLELRPHKPTCSIVPLKVERTTNKKETTEWLNEPTCVYSQTHR